MLGEQPRRYRTLAARRVPFALARRLVTERPTTITKVIEVLRNAPGDDPAE